jgi:hypothetical protein
MAYTTIDDPSAFFQTALWTGTGGVGNAVTFDGNSDMQPDFVWSKRRDLGGRNHVLKDTSRGGTSNNDLLLSSSLTDAESTYDRYRMDFNSDGFTLDGDGDTGFQGSGTSMVSWAWKANGGTTASNTDGSITSTVQANQDAGFSIVTYGGTGSAATLGHGLADTPDVIIFKNRDDTNVWATYHQGIGNNEKLVLNTTAAEDEDGSFMNGTLPTSSVFSVGASVNTNGSGDNYVAYCFAEKQGYSKFGKYVGNANTNGTFVYLGFKPAFVMVKNYTNAGHDWQMLDTKITPNNPYGTTLVANGGGAEISYTICDIVSNGFKFRNTNSAWNGSGEGYIYMAFAENPFTTSTGIPATAR